MQTSYKRIFKALCATTVLAALAACGSSSTVDPFTPTRVFGLGDGYNVAGAVGQVTKDPDATKASTVVEQVAYRFGLPSYIATYGAPVGTTGTYTYAVANSKIDDGSSTDLESQITSLLSAVTNFTDKDMIVLTVGTQDIMAGTLTADATAKLKLQVRRLLKAKASRILVVQPFEVANSPWGRNYIAQGNSLTGKTLEFIYGDQDIKGESTILNELSKEDGVPRNAIIFTAMISMAPEFNSYVNGVNLELSSTDDYQYGEFTTSTRVPYCGHGTSTSDSSTSGCAIDSDTTYATRLYADGIHLTPAGNRWVGERVFGATSTLGWR